MSCLSCLVHSHMLVPAVTFSPQAPRSADPSGTAEVSAPLGKVSEWIVLAFRCTVRFLPEAALLKLCSRVNLPIAITIVTTSTIKQSSPTCSFVRPQASWEFGAPGGRGKDSVCSRSKGLGM